MLAFSWSEKEIQAAAKITMLRTAPAKRTVARLRFNSTGIHVYKDVIGSWFSFRME